MTTAASLWQANLDLVERCAAHRFVQGIASGDLPRPAFEFYVAQDAVFLDAFARSYALAIAKAPDTASMRDFKCLLDGVFDELGLHREYAREWNVDLAPEPAPATRAYTDFLLRVAALEPIDRTCAAMTPCMRLYADLGRRLAPGVAPDNPYLAWVEAYANPAFEDLAADLEALLDRYSRTVDGEVDPVTADHYRTALRLEHDFFEAVSVVGQAAL